MPLYRFFLKLALCALVMAAPAGCGGQPDPIPRVLRSPSPSPTAISGGQTQALGRGLWSRVEVQPLVNRAQLTPQEVRHAR